MRLTVRKNSQITIPARIRRQAHLEEGDVLDAQYRDGVILLRPMKLIEASQAWFWTERWQQMEREAQDDIDHGRVKHFSTVEEAIDYLHGTEE